MKTDTAHHLLEAIETLAAHKSFFTSEVSETLLKSFLRSPSKSILTPREREIVQLIAEGHSNKQIAIMLGVSPKTVGTHRAAVMRKLNLSS